MIPGGMYVYRTHDNLYEASIEQWCALLFAKRLLDSLNRPPPEMPAQGALILGKKVDAISHPFAHPLIEA
ncbi:hypothetical protein AWB65_06439 [Caballeronia humi]|uniref:Uncharacterized protein n=1 Tax=Caballeronia humi TaxID=326474 RepID=A0A158JEY5_9BURK|nr:hypothetical protein AWB65_06439 [Caballeronia humi]